MVQAVVVVVLVVWGGRDAGRAARTSAWGGRGGCCRVRHRASLLLRQGGERRQSKPLLGEAEAWDVRVASPSLPLVAVVNIIAIVRGCCCCGWCCYGC